MKTVLIVSNTGDIHSDYLVASCNRLGVACFRLNTDRFRTSGRIAWDICPNDGVLEIDGHRCVLAEVDLLIFRRPVPVHQLRRDIEPWVGRLLDLEWVAIENALSAAVRGVVMNSIDGSAIAQNKIIQLMVAKRLGMSVPETLISTDTSNLRSFLARHDCVTKGVVNAFVVSQGVLRSAPTKKVVAADLDNYNADGCPTLLQQAIEPHAIWRVVSIGEKVLGFRFFGPELLEKTDSRDVEERLEGEHLPVPGEMGGKLIEMCKALSIKFASSDIIEDSDGRLWFLDLNPEGQWGFLQDKFDVDISGEIIKLCGV